MAESSHSDLINTLVGFYTLLDTLAAIPPNSVYFAPHPRSMFNKEAAIAAGYSPETADLLSGLPYLDVKLETEWELLPSTFPVTYLGSDKDEGEFESLREMLHDEMMPPTAFRITRSATYGFDFIYDTKTKLMVPWKPIDNPDEVDDYFHVRAAPPHEVMAEVVDNYRRLNYLGTPKGVAFNHSLFSESAGQPPQDWDERFRRQWRAQYDVWAATRKLKDIYIECGWNLNAVEQPNFRRDEFLVKREQYWQEEVKPLIKIEEETS